MAVAPARPARHGVVGPPIGGAAGRLRLRVARAAGHAALTLFVVLCAGGGSAAAMPALYLPPACQTVTFHSAPRLEAQRVCMNLGVRTHGTQPGTYLVLTPGAAGVGVYRDNGALVWWHGQPAGATESHDAVVVRLWGRSLLAVWSGRQHMIGVNHAPIQDGIVTLYDRHYRRVGTITAGRPFSPNQLDMHEFRVTPQGDALVDIYRPVPMTVNGHAEIVVDCVVQKLSLVRDARGIHTGRVLFQWSSLGHVPVSSSRLPDPGPGGAWDYFHLNAVAQDTDGDLLLSARSTWGVYKVNATSGGIIWQLGARGDPALPVPWCYQHDITALGANEYSLYDDGGEGPGCWPRLNWHAARGLIFRVDPSVRPVRLRLLHSYTHRPPIHSEFVGSTQRIADGSVLVSWGTTPQITEYSPSGGRLRFRWTGLPRRTPALAAQSQPGGQTEVWASWNGATQVRAWRLLAGSDARHLRAMRRAVPATGFETAVVLARRFRAVAVQALGGNGQVLRRSRVIRPAVS
jgi:hypothetical protein